MDEEVRQQRHDDLAALVRGFATGGISRRDFTKRALALGLSGSVVGLMASAYGAVAQEATEEPSNPITVTVGGTPIAVTEEDTANATPGGTLRFARAEDSTNLDPVTTPFNANIWILMNVYDQLVRVAPNGIELEPGLAETWEISEDGKTYTFRLRQGVTFSDGTPMKASDVKYSLERAANDPNQVWTFTLTALQRDANGQATGITAPDDTTVVVELAQPWAPFLADVAMFNCSVISEAFAKGNEARLVEEMLGTGPFALAEWRKGEYLSLTKNPHYWDPGFPFLDEVRVSVVPDDNSRVLQIQGGEIDAMYNVPASRVPELKQDGNLKVIEFPSTYCQFVSFNLGVEPLDDPNVRLALSHATDRQTLIDIVLFGAGVEATSLLPRGALYWNDQLPGFPYDVAKAQEYLAASKAAGGFTLELMFLAGVVDDEQLAAALKDMWSQIGVEVTLVPSEQSVYYDAFSNVTFQSMVVYWTNDIIDPDELVSFSVLPESNNGFRTSYDNPEVIDLARSGAAEMDSDRRKEIYFRLQELYNQDVPMIPIFHKPFIDITTTTVHNFQHPPTGQWVWKKTWLEQ
jgi:peptide/nickel transport system substrate-binding protein